MQSITETVELNAPASRAFAYLADLNNFSAWATEFCRGTRRENGNVIADTGMGDMVVRVRADAATGVIDIFANPTADGTDFMPTRVLALPDGRTAFSVTFVRPPELGDDIYAQQCASLRHELSNIQRLVR